MTAMTRRVEAAQATLDAFKDKPLVWGERDCGRLAAHILKGLGYKPALARFGFYKSEAGAWRALKKAGFDSLEAAVDDLGLERIPPASALPGDIVGFRHPVQGRWTALAVAMGNGRLLGFHEATGCCHIGMADYHASGGEVMAWRADPCPL